MNESFNKFKRKIWLGVLLLCIAVGVAVGLLAVTAVLLPCKLYGVELFPLYYVLIALGGVLIGGGLAFLFLRTDDQKIAKRLDAELGLQERVQTALVYSGQNSDMLDLQRENAIAELDAKPVKILPVKNLFSIILCGVILLVGVVSVPVVACCVPSVFAQTQGTQEEPPREVSEWEWAALDELIAYVQASQKADAATKQGMTTELTGLKRVLQNGVSQSSLSGFVQNTVTNIRNAVRAANAQSGVSDSQKELNSEEETYVVNKLYEIFSLKRPTESGGDGDGDGDDGDDDKPSSTGGNAGLGNLNIDDIPFFDPELGYVKCGEVRSEYYARVQQALNEGIISKEEWEYIMATYFADLTIKEK